MNQKVRSAFRKSFGGLSREYLFRQYFFAIALAIAVMVFFSLVEQRSQTPDSELSWTFYILLTITTLLYPYSRWVYETVLGFILGRNLFIAPLDTFFLLKLFTMAMCFALAIWIAPIGLIAIYIYNTMQENKNSKEG